MAKDITKLFFELIQVSIGTKDCYNEVPSGEDWVRLFYLANKQSLTSLLIEGINKEPSLAQSIDKALLLEWIGLNQLTVSQNQLQNKRAEELYKLFREGGFRSTILKGQGTALYYEHPEYRQCGDIDVWVEGDRDEILNYIKGKGHVTDGIDVQHTNVKFFKDVEVEVHFLPSFMYSPFKNRILQRFFSDKAENQFNNYDATLGISHTTIDLDLVFSLVHIYRHLFSEGIGMRQLIDYYFILIHSNQEQRKEAFRTLNRLGMNSFTGGIMWILLQYFKMKEEYILCETNLRHGSFILSEMLIAGNFGHYDTRTVKIDPHDRVRRGFSLLKKNMRFLSFYPSEVLWSPIWKIWHYLWRKRKGYL